MRRLSRRLPSGRGCVQSEKTGSVFPETFSKRCATLRSPSRSLMASGPEARRFSPPDGKEFEDEVRSHIPHHAWLRSKCRENAFSMQGRKQAGGGEMRRRNSLTPGVMDTRT